MSDFVRTIGPLLLGAFLNTYAYGIVMFQWASYHNTRISDPFWIRSLVEFLFTINTFHCVVLIYMAYVYCVQNYVNPTGLTMGLWVNSVTPICIAITGLFAHLFLAYRFFRLTKNAISLGVFTMFSLTIFALSLAVGIMGLVQNLSLAQMSLDQSPSTYADLVRAWVILQAVFEAGLSGSVCYSLLHCTPPFIPSPENSPLTRTVRGAVQSGSIAFMFSLANMIGTLAGRTTTIFALFSMPIAPLYATIIFDTLLARRVSLGSPDINSMTSGDPNGIWFPTIPKTGSQTGSGNQSFSLHSIHVRTEVMSDNGRQRNTFDLGEDQGSEEADRKAPAVVSI